MPLTKVQCNLIILSVIVLGIIDYFAIRHYDANILELSPRSWCDEKSSLPDVIKCVDAIYKSSKMQQIWQQKIRQQEIRLNVNVPQATPLNTSYQEIHKFSPIKEKQYRVGIYNNHSELAVYDKFADLEVIYPQINTPGVILQSIKYLDKENKCKIETPNLLPFEIFHNWTYPGDRPFLSKDVLITQTQNTYKIYTASYEAVRLRKNKALYVIGISAFGEAKNGFDYEGTHYIYFIDDYNPQKDYLSETSLPAKYKQDKNLFLNCPPYTRTINYIPNPNQPEKEIVLSADKRKNPQILFVNVNNHSFSIDISHIGENK